MRMAGSKESTRSRRVDFLSNTNPPLAKLADDMKLAMTAAIATIRKGLFRDLREREMHQRCIGCPDYFGQACSSWSNHNIGLVIRC